MKEGRGVKKESKIAAAITAVIDIVTAGLLWLLCSLPVVTIGAASAALYYSVVKCIRHERGRLVKSFFAAFRRDFRIATLLWLIFLGAALLFSADVFAFSRMGGSSLPATIGKILLLALPAFFPWVFAFVSRFSNTVSGTLKFCGYLALKNIGVTLRLRRDDLPDAAARLSSARPCLPAAEPAYRARFSSPYGRNDERGRGRLV